MMVADRRDRDARARELVMMRWRSSTWARWLGWTVMFGLALAGATLVFSAFAPAYPALFWALLVAVAVLAFLIGVRLQTWWWVLGPVVAYGVPAASYMIAANARYQSLEHKGIEGLTWDWFVVLAYAAFVVAPCMLAAAAGVTWAAVSRSRASGGRQDRFTPRWSRMGRFCTVQAADPQEEAPPG